MSGGVTTTGVGEGTTIGVFVGRGVGEKNGRGVTVGITGRGVKVANGDGVGNGVRVLDGVGVGEGVPGVVVTVGVFVGVRVAVAVGMGVRVGLGGLVLAGVPGPTVSSSSGRSSSKPGGRVPKGVGVYSVRGLSSSMDRLQAPSMRVPASARRTTQHEESARLLLKPLQFGDFDMYRTITQALHRFNFLLTLSRW